MQAGEIIGDRFAIVAHAGSGGMGQVYRARDLQTGELCALKLVTRPDAVELHRFSREAQALAAVRLPGVVRYVAHGVTSAGQPYLAMEWLIGETLAERLGQLPLSVAECIALGARVATTLGAVHRLGIVHRDLKPRNLLVAGGEIERVMLLDFGIARMSWLAQELTVPGVVLGTPGYIAPEQARGQDDVDARADVFALGCVLYRCLTGRAAFQGPDSLSVLTKVLHEEPPLVREIRGDVPPALEDLVARMLSKSRDDRPPSGSAVAAALAAIEMSTRSGPSSFPPISARTQEITAEERKVTWPPRARSRLDGDDRTSGDAALQGDTEPGDQAGERGTMHRLLGKPVPYLGRDRELAQLTSELSRCVEERVTSAVLVTGAAGMGKSRLRREFVRAVRQKGAEVEVWIGHADPMSVGSAFRLLAHAIRDGLGIDSGDPIEARRRAIEARVARHPSLDARRVAAFLGELAFVPFPDDGHVQLRAARRDPRLMSDQLRRAWEDFLRAECAARPVVLVLEDLHWGDLPTVNLVDVTLRNLVELPFMVLALARPEVHKLLPNLWEHRSGHELRLAGLSRRASEQLVRRALDGASAELVATLVERADGNAFYLEELIRAAASGAGEALPESVIAMVQAGLSTLDAEARRALRAASVFGETFSRRGVAALAGGSLAAAKLLELEHRELIHREAAASGDLTFRFRHALVREAAYGMLTDGDRELGHALAAEWIEQAGDADPIALAEHFERGKLPARAAVAYLGAARQALQGNDLGAAVERAERGLACSAEPDVTGALRLVQAQAHLWRGEYALAEERGLAAIERLVPGSAAWFTAVSQTAIAAGRVGAFDRTLCWTEAARTAVALEDAQIARLVCLSAVATVVAFGGSYAAADALIEAIDRASRDPDTTDVQVIARLELARSLRAQASGDPSAWRDHAERSRAAFEQAGDLRNACIADMNLGFLLGQLGEFEAAETALRAALATAERLELVHCVNNVLQNLGPVLAHRGRHDEAKAAAEQAIAGSQRMGEVRIEGGGRTYLAEILLMAGDGAGAAREAGLAVELLRSTPPLLAYAIGVQARALLARGRLAEALSAAREARALLESAGAEEGESLVRLVHAEALAASGDRREADAAIGAARDHLLRRAAKIGDAALRERFLRDVPDNARTLELARLWLGSG